MISGLKSVRVGLALVSLLASPGFVAAQSAGAHRGAPAQKSSVPALPTIGLPLPPISSPLPQIAVPLAPIGLPPPVAPHVSGARPSYPRPDSHARFDSRRNL